MSNKPSICQLLWDSFALKYIWDFFDDSQDRLYKGGQNEQL